MVNISNLSYHEDVVTKIEKSNNFTVDIEVEDEHNYVMDNGMISHNSSIICDNVSNGIEPVFEPEYIRAYIVEDWPDGLNRDNVKTVLNPIKQGNATIWKGVINGTSYIYEPHNRGLCVEEKVRDYGYGWVCDNFPEDIKEKKDYLITANKLSIDEHIAVQAIIQKNCSQSISKTINLPNNFSLKDYKSLFLKAWKEGLIGITTYRDGSMESVLSKVRKNNGTREIIKKDIKLPTEFINGPMKVIKREGMKFYLHFSYLPEDSEKIFPIAIWLHSNSFGEMKESNAAVRVLTDLLEKFNIDKNLIETQKRKMKENPGHQKVSKMISMCLRHNVPIVNIVHVLDSLKEVYVTDAIYSIKKFLGSHIEDGTSVIGVACSSCKSVNIVYAGGCTVCKDCGNSACN